MRDTLTAVFSLLLACVLTGGALFMLFFGADGVVMLVYGFFPYRARVALWEWFRPERASISVESQALAALVMLVAGTLLIARVWTKYPKYRAPMLAMTGALIVATVIFAELAFSPMPLF